MKSYLRLKLFPPGMYGFRHLGNHKAIDFSVHWWSIEHGIHLFDVSLRIDWKTDHGGVHFMLVCFNFV